eukprot:TRINITY_DN94_c0_g1_i17.p1 TRINITY_DN94_c0_g1~~TRINITY_DN94_c0_g1_i17.p1  ORF type:complete len:131 (+),score=8.60 TRINITY_DN94_c0_g1_i17:122-514(+)
MLRGIVLAILFILSASATSLRGTKYFTYDSSSGQLSNQLFALHAALCFSSLYNRTLIFEGFKEFQIYTAKSPRGVPYDFYMDKSHLKSHFQSILDYDEFKAFIEPILQESSKNKTKETWSKSRDVAFSEF